MKYYVKIIMLCWLSVGAVRVQGQEVQFVSPAVESAVRHHLNVSDEASIGFSQLDTITYLDLSRRGVTDTQDLILMPNLRVLNLSDNSVNDLRPLAVLDSLEYVNLSGNNLLSINDLIGSLAKKMTVNVSFNRIKDFSLFCSVLPCEFTLNGTGLQLSDDAPYFDVYQLYADVGDGGTSKACWRGYTNMEADVTLKCGTLQVAASLDGYTNSVNLPYELDGTTQVVLSNGEVGDTTYVVPPAVHIVNGGDKVTIDTELPESYQIGYLRSLHGTVESDGAKLHYTAPSPIVADTLYISYYEGNRIRGFAQMYFMAQDFYDGVKDIKQDSPLKMSLHDGVLSIAGLPAQKDGMAAVIVYDALGRTLATQTADGQKNISVKLPSNPGIVIVEVTYAGGHFVAKVAAK